MPLFHYYLLHSTRFLSFSITSTTSTCCYRNMAESLVASFVCDTISVTAEDGVLTAGRRVGLCSVLGFKKMVHLIFVREMLLLLPE